MDIITSSHISKLDPVKGTRHAAGPNFPTARSADGRFEWQSGMEGYVIIDPAVTGLAVVSGETRDDGRYACYLQYANHPDAIKKTIVPDDLLADARAFSRAVQDLRDRRECESEERYWQAVEAKHATMPDHVRTLFARYGSSDAAWEEEDDSAAAVMAPYELPAPVRGLPEDFSS